MKFANFVYRLFALRAGIFEPKVVIFTARNTNTVEPLLSGHPRGSDLWPLNRGGR